MKITTKLLPIILNILSICVLLVLLFQNAAFLLSPSFDKFVFNSDYFINYTSGFIKRGLDGQLIYAITAYTGFSPINILRVLYLIFFVSLSGIVINILYRSKISLFYIFSPFLFLFPFVYFQLYHISKDVEVLLIAYIVLYLFINGKSKWLLNIALSLGILAHESIFIFLFFPLLLIQLFYIGKGSVVQKLLNFGISLAPSIIIFLLIFLKFNGLSNNIQIIYDSWKPYSTYLQDVHFNSGLFDGRPRLISDIIKESYNMIGLGLLIGINFVFITAGAYLYSRQNFLVLLGIALLQIIPVVILCAVASDFGRWFFLSNSILLFSMFLLQGKVPSVNFSWGSGHFIMRTYEMLSFPMVCILFVLGGMPYLGFNIYRYFYSNPIRIILDWL
ncbi:hypothetical protein SAMN05421768_103642 [Chryseobacterium joostei]|uniref:EpsG family protein n=1 Tax=Chryseobacterium joostei TaxID=112234 RepID=A0A1N7IAR7_9FLAO|nr:hypothetical protein [Chryseobacterium joostei]SIS34196.1 hypothetical protein SAMN05421768_103642 [Chryseobacterium joostei]